MNTHRHSTLTILRSPSFYLVLILFLAGSGACSSPTPLPATQASIVTESQLPTVLTTFVPTQAPIAPVPTLAPAPTQPTPGEDRVSSPGEYSGYSEPLYFGRVESSQYITARDGTRLAMTIYRPAVDGQAVETPLPVIWTHTRYRREALPVPAEWLSRLLRHGYVIATVDVRGSGASFGTWLGPFSPEETIDAYDVTEWLAAQPWSNGEIGMFGPSYLGITEYMAASAAPPHLKAIYPLVGFLDLYNHVYTGGIFRSDRVAQWTERVAEIDSAGAPVDEDTGGALLAQALQAHAGNISGFDMASILPFRDSVLPETGRPIYLENTPSAYLDQIEASGVAIYHATGWFDPAAASPFLFFNNLNNPQKIVIGPWSHTLDTLVDQEYFDHGVEMLRWFDYWLKGIENGIMQEPPIYYYTMGSSAGRGWHSASQWPPPEARTVSMYFQNYPANSIDSVNDGSLDLEPPAEAQAWDEYTVDYSTTSGTATRWDSGFGGSFGYGDLASNDRKGLTYTSAELPQNLEFTGHPIAHLWVSTKAEDFDLFLYLEDVGTDGASRYVTEGALRASHRALSEPPYDLLRLPYHPSYTDDIRPLSGEPVELIFELIPTSHSFAAGHRLRFTLTGADADNALTPRLDPSPTIRVYTEAGRASYVAMPLVLGR